MTEVIVEDSRGGKHPSRFRTIGSSAAAISSLEEVEPSDGVRIRTGIAELDRAIGGGVVAGSVVLIGGDPGIGKSTLLIQTLSAMTDEIGVRTLYVTGEESVQQVSLRARREG